MARYTSQELCDMILLYGETRGNAARALNLYRERNPNRRHPANGRVIVNAVQCVRDDLPISGRVQPPQGPGAAFNVRLALERRILQHFRERPTTSTRRAVLQQSAGGNKKRNMVPTRWSPCSFHCGNP
ncbi:uncharacterized protein LOC125230953 [Leguminivora glycinivorella]|uniref:uncharacterized protein LOC125230953 n=1 Tax=Leguminivora glycinivorella TaxID=1035111 RepID=UPI00200C1C2D|nr:uncharacterized protein LOC125230953 [Leguminivora glycinivorella]